MTLSPTEEADRFSRQLGILLLIDEDYDWNVERVGLAALRVVLDSGTAVIVTVEAEGAES